MKNKQIIKNHKKTAYQGYNKLEGKTVNISSVSNGTVWKFPGARYLVTNSEITYLGR